MDAYDSMFVREQNDDGILVAHRLKELRRNLYNMQIAIISRNQSVMHDCGNEKEISLTDKVK